MYSDMREFLATRTDIDALLIATGDRWHALAATMAMRAGKDVYSEKPSSMTIAEGRAVVETAKRYGRVYQTGTQRLSEAQFRVLHRDGAPRPARQGAHGLRAHRAVGRRRDEARLAARRTRTAQGRGGLGSMARPMPMAALQPRLRRAAAGAGTTISTRVASANGARTRSPRPRPASARATPRPLEYHYVNNDSGDGMVRPCLPTAIKMILSRGDKHWQRLLRDALRRHGRLGFRRRRLLQTGGLLPCPAGGFQEGRGGLHRAHAAAR